MRLVLLFYLLLTGWLAAAEKPVALVVTGAPGTEEYGQLFAEWGGQWKSAAEQADATFHQVGQPDDDMAKDALMKFLQ